MPTLEWIGKKAVVNHHREVPTRLLHCDPAHSCGDPEAGNLLVQGDNLEALKALLPFYAGKVKCIYIDPPFNTGSEDWIYNDNVNSPEIRAWLGKVVGKEAEDLSRHDKWLCMMYPRLRLLRDFLSVDGTIFVHIDDNEFASSVLLADEVFGRNNRCYVITFKQASATGHKSINPGCVLTTNYILIYARSKANWSPNKVATARERDARYSQFILGRDGPIEGWKITSLMEGFAAETGIALKDARKLVKDTPEVLDEFVKRFSKAVIQPARPDFESVGRDTQLAIEQSRARPDEIIVARRDNHPDIYLKGGQRILFYEDKLKWVDGELVAAEPLTTLWDDILSNNIHKEGGVDFPKGKKPEALIKRCLELCTKEGDLVLDSFAGSGSTAATAHKMNRKWLAIEMFDHAATHIAPRMTSVVDGTDPNGISRSVNWTGGGGYRYCRLGHSLFDEFGGINGEIAFPDLAAFTFFADTGSPIPKRAKADSPLIGDFQGRAIYLLYAQESQGVPSTKFGNVLTPGVLNRLPTPEEGFDGRRVVYAEGCTVPAERLAALSVTFKQIPYQLEGL